MGVLTPRDLRGLLRERLAAADREYATLGWPTVLGHRPLADRWLCSCGDPACAVPGGHPASPRWQQEVTVDAEVAARRRTRHPEANILLATGYGVDVLEVPAPAGAIALHEMECIAGALLGPVAVNASRYLFFLRRQPDGPHRPPNEATSASASARRREFTVLWHARESYVLVPPSMLPDGGRVFWLRHPGGRTFPDPLTLAETLVAACTRLGYPGGIARNGPT